MPRITSYVIIGVGRFAIPHAERHRARDGPRYAKSH